MTNRTYDLCAFLHNALTRQDNKIVIQYLYAETQKQPTGECVLGCAALLSLADFIPSELMTGSPKDWLVTLHQTTLMIDLKSPRADISNQVCHYQASVTILPYPRQNPSDPSKNYSPWNDMDTAASLGKLRGQQVETTSTTTTCTNKSTNHTLRTYSHSMWRTYSRAVRWMVY